MRIICCSSGCCGVKHIRDFMYCPTNLLYLEPSTGYDDDANTTEPRTDRWEIIKGAARTVVAGDHFRFLMNQLMERRPHGLVTINLAAESKSEWCCEDCDGPYEDFDHGDSYDTEWVDNWRPLFEEFGFTETTFINSNSGNRVHHFTLAY